MAMVSAVVASMAAFYHDTTDITIRATARSSRTASSPSCRPSPARPTSTRSASRSSIRATICDYCSNMLNMFFAVPCEPYAIDPVAAEALDLLFILHADHEQNASTSTVRLAGSTGTNPYAAISAGVSRRCGVRRTAAPTRRCSTCSSRSARSRTSRSSSRGQGQARDTCG
jgi:citrate synthase